MNDDQDPDHGASESAGARRSTDLTSALELDAAEGLVAGDAVEVGEALDGVFAIAEGSRGILGASFQQAIAPHISGLVAGGAFKSVIDASSTLAQIGTFGELVPDSAYKSILESNASTWTNALSGFAETLGQSNAHRAAFSLASGLRATDSLAPVIEKLVADTGGLGIAQSALAATLGGSLNGFGVTALGLNASSALASLAIDAGPKIDVSGVQAAFEGSEAIRSVVNGLAGPEIARTRSLAMQQLVATSGIGDLIASDQMGASWRQSLLSEATARSLIGTMVLPEAGGASLLSDIVAANTATARVVGRYAELNEASILAPTVSARPSRELRAFLARIPVAPDIDKLTFAVRASRSVAGIAAADLLVAGGTVDDDAGELFEDEIVEPWLNGPEALRSMLFSRLDALDPHVSDLLRGAWAQVEQNGPAATSMASHAVQEAIDRTLRALAPADLVLRLFDAGRLPRNSVHEKDGGLHPTRAGRIAAALHERRPTETKLIAAQAKAIAASVTFLTESLQGGKHASNGTVGLVRTWLVAVEATFTQLLYEPGDG